uniref:Uncharacterized protein n=1 Tax=Anguilla anguilla TaxID=7936 RepID=A0A0E9Q140_ANGAN
MHVLLREYVPYISNYVLEHLKPKRV